MGKQLYSTLQALGVIIMYSHSALALPHFQNLLYFPCALLPIYILLTLLYCILYFMIMQFVLGLSHISTTTVTIDSLLYIMTVN